MARTRSSSESDGEKLSDSSKQLATGLMFRPCKYCITTDLIVPVVTISRAVCLETVWNDLHTAAALVCLREDSIQILSGFAPAGLDTLHLRQHPAIALLVNGVRLKKRSFVRRTISFPW